MTTFRDAMDRLRLSANETAELFGLAPQTVRQMRLDPESPHCRNAPPNWREVFARIARERAPELQKLAEELEGEGCERSRQTPA